VQLGQDQTVWLLGSLCGLQRLPFDGALFLQKFPPPHSETTFIDAARALGFRIGAVPLDLRLLKSLASPCVAVYRPAEGGIAPPDDASLVGASPSHSAPVRVALLLRGDDDRVLYFEAGSSRPQQMSPGEVLSRFEPECFLAALDKPGADLADGEPQAAEVFGYGWFLRELARHRGVWLQVIAASLVIQVIGLCTPLFTQVIIDKVVVHQTLSTLQVISAAMVVFVLFSCAMSWLRQYFVVHTGNRVDAVLGSRLLQHLFRLPLTYFEQRSTGTLVARVHAVESIREFIAGAAVALLLDLPFLLLFLLMMVWYSWQLALIAVAIVGLIALASLLVTPLLRARLDRQFLQGARNQAFLTEHIVGIETVKSLQMEPRLEARYEENLAAYLAASFDSRQLSNAFGTVVHALEQGMTVMILGMGALLVMRNDGFTIGMLVAFQMFAARLSQPMLRLAGLWQEFQQAGIAVRRLGDVMNAPAEPHSLQPSRLSQGQGRLEIQGLAFSHRGMETSLYRGLSTIFEPGELVLVTGPSGCGKSTFAKLLLGFYPPTAGRILLDGRDIRHLSANELRMHFGVVPQETVLFSGSLHDNLSLAAPHASAAEIVEACRMAGIHEDIERLPRSYQTVIGENGTGLSGGQKQRIAIARALLRHPRILIFDEATASLDERTAAQLAQTVNRFRGDMTVLVIAHHMPPGLQPDRELQLGN
jgi:subfamily B ATP-binding cassette protein HlyB/CyaB